MTRTVAALLAALLLSACAGEAPARERTAASPTPTPSPSVDPVVEQPFAVPVPGTDEVTVTEATYDAADGERGLWTYAPAGSDPTGLVVVVQGPSPGAETAAPVVAWARLVAASGQVAVVADYGGTEGVDEDGAGNLDTVLADAKTAHPSLPVSVLGFSAGGPYAVRLAAADGVERAAFAYARVEPTAPAAPADPSAYSLSRLAGRPGSPALFVAFGAQDTAPGILAANRRFVRAAGDRAEIRRHPGGHAFELTGEETVEGRAAARIVRSCLAFLQP